MSLLEASPVIVSLLVPITCRQAQVRDLKRIQEYASLLASMSATSHSLYAAVRSQAPLANFNLRT